MSPSPPTPPQQRRRKSIPFDPNFNPVLNSRLNSRRKSSFGYDTIPVNHITFLTKWNRRAIAWKLIYLVCFAVCFTQAFYQAAKLLDIYFKYPTTVAVSVESKPNLTLPGITFCSSIGVRKSDLLMMPGFEYAMKEMTRKILIENNASVTNSEKQKVLDYFHFEYLEKTPLDQVVTLGLNFTEFVIVNETKCALDQVIYEKNKTISCRKEVTKNFIETFQGNHVCWTLFHASKANVLNQVFVPSGYTHSALFIRDLPNDSKDQEVSSTEEDETMQPLEIIRFMINFTQEESVKLDTPAVGSVIVHDPDLIRLGRLQSKQLKPGRLYEIFIEEEESELLPFPYPTNCYPYLERNLNDHIKHSHAWFSKPHPLFSKPLSSTDCMYGCLGLESVKTCSCWPPEIPHVNSKLYQSLGEGKGRFINSGLKLCDWIKRSRENKKKNKTLSVKSQAMKEFRRCFSDDTVLEKCQKQCPRECIKTRIKSSSQSKQWPSNERIKYAKMNEVSLLNHLRNCCSVVSIRMASNEIMIHSYSPKYEAVE